VSLLAFVLLTGGVLVTLIAAIGLLRLRDPLQRMHSATKAGTLGTTLIVFGTLIMVDDVRPSTAILTIAFLLFTLPIGAQLLGRASYLSGVPLKGVPDDAVPEMERTMTERGMAPVERPSDKIGAAGTERSERGLGAPDK
jgi:multicomponent Na+:H+ antiporter subunit G